MDAARINEPQPRVVCDVCGAQSVGARGRACQRCAVGTLRYLSEIDLLRRGRADARRAHRAELSDR